MPYTAEHRETTRSRILASAKRLFRRHGYAAVSIEAIMGEAGLTRGGFYLHFNSKEELFLTAIKSGVVSALPADWADKSDGGKRSIENMVRAYLSDEHFHNDENSCPLISFPAEACKGGERIQEAYREVAESIAKTLEAPLSGVDSRNKSLALLALCVGGMVVSRGVGDSSLSRDIRTACVKFALKSMDDEHEEEASV